MHAMVLDRPGEPLHCREVPVPEPGRRQVLLQVHACGVCRTDLHIVDGELPHPKLPLIPGHEIVGTVVRRGKEAERFPLGERVGVPWLAWTDQTCPYCQRERENLCQNALFTGYTVDGGYAQYTVADERYCFPLPPSYGHAEAAPLLCAGFIGYRSYRMAGEHVGKLGLYGFGAAAHIIAQVAVYQGKRIYAFTRPGDVETQEFARRLGAVWAGGSDEMPPERLNAAIIYAPVGPLVPAALRSSDKAATVVCAGIHMSDIPSFPYRILWEERVVRSVANLTRRDGEEFLRVAPEVPVRTTVTTFPLERANEALAALRQGRVEGAAVLVME
ncbi:MAG: zinc-dependent alcohol dehydrogenase family protein [Anaerolineae bacterium]|nr:zinc-dependent alcohol dehydrogenase family protein [Anaerolineae bacterium]